MELRHLRYFEAVAEHLHFGRAAEALMTAQPSLSRQIIQLEEELGVRLFDRANKHVELTSVGRLFLVDTKRTLAAADASIRHVRESADGSRGELRLGFLGGAMMLVLPIVLREYRRRFSGVRVEPHALPYSQHLTALLAGTIDIAWTIAAADPEIVSQTVAQDRMLVVLPANHTLVANDGVDIADFVDETLIVIARSVSPRLFDATINICLTRGYRPKNVIEVLEEQTVLGLVAAEFGIAIVPHPWSVIRIPGIVFRPYPNALFIDEALSWRRDRETPIVRAFVATAMEILKGNSSFQEAMERPER